MPRAGPALNACGCLQRSSAAHRPSGTAPSCSSRTPCCVRTWLQTSSWRRACASNWRAPPLLVFPSSQVQEEMVYSACVCTYARALLPLHPTGVACELMAFLSGQARRASSASLLHEGRLSGLRPPPARCPPTEAGMGEASCIALSLHLRCSLEAYFGPRRRRTRRPRTATRPMWAAPTPRWRACWPPSALSWRPRAPAHAPATRVRLHAVDATLQCEARLGHDAACCVSSGRSWRFIPGQVLVVSLLPAAPPADMLDDTIRRRSC